MKIVNSKKTMKGFTLVEMIGVLAVIAILAGMLIPKIFESIRSARINATLAAYNTLKAAALENFAKWGKFATTSGGLYVGNSFDGILFAEGRIEARAYDKIPIAVTNSTSYVQLSVTTSLGNNGSGYNLDGTGGIDTTNAYLCELVIIGAPAKDAQELSMRLDGLSLSQTSGTLGDSLGRVEYTAPTAGKVNVYMYIAHQ